MNKVLNLGQLMVMVIVLGMSMTASAARDYYYPVRVTNTEGKVFEIKYYQPIDVNIVPKEGSGTSVMAWKSIDKIVVDPASKDPEKKGLAAKVIFRDQSASADVRILNEQVSGTIEVTKEGEEAGIVIRMTDIREIALSPYRHRKVVFNAEVLKPDGQTEKLTEANVGFEVLKDSATWTFGCVIVKEVAFGDKEEKTSRRAAKFILGGSESFEGMASFTGDHRVISGFSENGKIHRDLRLDEVTKIIFTKIDTMIEDPIN